MTPVIDFMTSILYCRECPDRLKCDGVINCPWLSPHDEANCSQQCPSSWSFKPIPCDCNEPENMMCEGSVQEWVHRNRVCYLKDCKLVVLFYFCKRHND